MSVVWELVVIIQEDGMAEEQDMHQHKLMLIGIHVEEEAQLILESEGPH